MALGDFAKRLLGSRTPQPETLESKDDTDQHRSAPVDTDVQECAPAGTDAEDCEPLIFGSMRSAREHAEKVVEFIRATGRVDCSIYQGEIENLHAEICEGLNWVPRLWPAVGSELVGLPGV